MSRIHTLALKINKILFPEEIFILFSLFIFYLVYLLKNWQIIFWDPSLTFVTINRIAFPFTIFFVLTIFKLAFTKTSNTDKFVKIILNLFFDALRIWGLFYITLIIHMNIKIKVPFFNDNLYDQAYLNFDNLFSWLINIIFIARNYIQNFFDLSIFYAMGYESMFLVTFCLIYLINKKIFRRMFFATILVLILGSIAYCAFPAIGPFAFGDSSSAYIHEVQNVMTIKYILYRDSLGVNYSPAYLIQGIAAMPSLHVANTLVFLYFVYKSNKKIAIIYAMMFFYVCIDAIYTKYHYIADIFAGFALAIFCIYLAQWIYQKREKLLENWTTISK